MSTYKLHYFNVRGRAETSRMMFKLQGQQFEDIRYDITTDWQTKKAETPFGQLPYLEVDGEVFCQSHAFERLLAKRFGRYGDNDIEQAKTDMVVDCLEDIGKSSLKHTDKELDLDEDKKAEMKNRVFEEKLPAQLEKLEKMATPTGFIAGKSLMWPDIWLYNCIEFLGAYLLEGQKVNLDRTPKLKAIVDHVANDPCIAKWLKERPQGLL